MDDLSLVKSHKIDYFYINLLCPELILQQADTFIAPSIQLMQISRLD